jgi:hypothetical protein
MNRRAATLGAADGFERIRTDFEHAKRAGAAFHRLGVEELAGVEQEGFAGGQIQAAAPIVEPPVPIQHTAERKAAAQVAPGASRVPRENQLDAWKARPTNDVNDLLHHSSVSTGRRPMQARKRLPPLPRRRP